VDTETEAIMFEATYIQEDTQNDDNKAKADTG